MEEKVIKQIKTSCPFPLLIFKTSVTYNEVKKASGIAYILLDLIQKTSTSKERISDILLKFGIPDELHYIFGKEIASLIGTEILKSTYPGAHFLNQKYFREIAIKDVRLTEKGKKMFSEGAIPTGAEKTKIKDIYFSPVTRKFNVSSELQYTSLESSFLGDKFLDHVDIDIGGLGDYLSANAAKIGLKSEERIVSFKTKEPQRMHTRKEDGMTIIIRSSGVEFAFPTSDEKAFFDKYYSSKLMTKGMLMKNNYKFVNSLKQVVTVPTAKLERLENVVNVYIPGDIQKQVQRPCKLFVNKGNLGLTREDNTIKIDSELSAELLNYVDKNAEFALIDSAGFRYYCALNVQMPCNKFGDMFEMQLLVENMATTEQFNHILQVVLNKYLTKTFDSESGKVVLFVAETLKDISCFERYVEIKLNEYESVDEKIAMLMKFQSTFNKNADWKQVFAKVGAELLGLSVSEVRLDNMIYKKTVLDPLKECLGISNTEYIRLFAKKVVMSEDSELVYQALETAGFSVSEILGVVNIVKKYMQAVLNNSKIEGSNALASKYSVLQINLWKLNKMLGIERYNDYTLKDDYEEAEFFNTYSTLSYTYKSLEKYRQYAVSEYGELKQYFDIYEPIHELLSMERTSASHPEKLTKKYIDDKIAKGKYKDAICDLLVKMQFDLRRILGNNDASADELINLAKNARVIEGSQADALHKLRICRNAFQHPERRQVAYDKKMIEQWRDIVFDIPKEEK